MIEATCPLCRRHCALHWEGAEVAGNACPRGAFFLREEVGREAELPCFRGLLKLASGRQLAVCSQEPVPLRDLFRLRQLMRQLRPGLPIHKGDRLASWQLSGPLTLLAEEDAE